MIKWFLTYHYQCFFLSGVAPARGVESRLDRFVTLIRRLPVEEPFHP
jgi:hypothetical protein